MSVSSTTLTWQGNFEWEHDDLRDRTGVVTKDWGPRNRHYIRMGLDPDYNSPSRAMHYWPLEEDPSATASTEDVIGGAEAYWEGDPLTASSVGSGGALGTNAPHFSPGGETQAVNFSDNANFDHGGGFTFAIFFETDDDRNLRTLFHSARPFDSDGGILVSKNEGPRIGVSIHANGQWYTEDDFHLGNMQLGQPYVMVVRYRNVNGEWRLGVELNGDMEERTVDFERPALDPSNNFGAVGSLWYADARDMGGEFDEMMYWDHGLGDFELQEIWDSYSDAYLLTRWKPAEGMATELHVIHDTPPETDPYITVVQDTTGDGNVDNFESVAMEQGTSTYFLDTDIFEDVAGYYSIEFNLWTTDPYVTPEFELGELYIEQVPPVGVWATGDDGVVDTDTGVILTE